MKTIMINVEDSNYEKVRDLLEHLTYVESINVFENLGSGAIRHNPPRDHKLIKTVKEENQDQGQNEDGVDEITILSQLSLSEEWDSEEDQRYDELYESKYLNNDIPKRKR